MFIRKKANPSGVISVQIIDKSSGKYRVVKTVGSSSDPIEVARLVNLGKQMLPKMGGQQVLDFTLGDDRHFLSVLYESMDKVQLLGPDLILGKLFNEIGFNKIEDELFRHLVISRLIYPLSKLKTVDYLQRYQGLSFEIDQVYRYLDKLRKDQYELVQQISYHHTLKVLGGSLSVVFYDVTTLYFEAEREDALRVAGFSKEGKHKHPQILIGLLVSVRGYPLAYEIFEGNKFEGHTMLPVIEAFKKRYQLEKLIIVADSGLLSKDNLEKLQQQGHEFIIGARIKKEAKKIQDKILNLKLKDGKSVVLKKEKPLRLIITYASARARKDAHNRERGLKRLENNLGKGKLTKKHINNRGYNKFLTMEGEVEVKIDYEKVKAESKWDGLKGYITNTSLKKEQVIESYQQLWQIEKAFRISKTDLKIRPVYHRLKSRIEAHICIAFCSYKLYKELERQIQVKKLNLSPEKVLDILKAIYGLKLNLPQSKKPFTMLLAKEDEQIRLLEAFNIPFGCPSA